MIAATKHFVMDGTGWGAAVPVTWRYTESDQTAGYTEAKQAASTVEAAQTVTRTEGGIK